jgi:hypothetical protein
MHGLTQQHLGGSAQSLELAAQLRAEHIRSKHVAVGTVWHCLPEAP